MNFSQTYTATGSMHHINIRAYVEDLMLQSVYDRLHEDLVIQIADGIDYTLWIGLREKLDKMGRL